MEDVDMLTRRSVVEFPSNHIVLDKYSYLIPSFVVIPGGGGT